MRTVTYKSVLRGAFALAGIKLSTAPDDDVVSMAEHLAEALKTAHEYWRWPELGMIEPRFFRAEWTAQAYAEDDEVYHLDTDAYYRASEAVADSDEPGDSDLWVEITEFNRYVEFTQSGQTPIEAVLEVWNNDPRLYTAALALYYRITNDGVSLQPSAPNKVFVEFRARCPDFAWESEWSAGSFAIEAVVYHEASGEVYRANAACSSSDVPGVSDKWTKLDVPYFASSAVKRQAYADWLEGDGQTDKAIVHAAKAEEMLEEQVWQYTKLQGQTGPTQRAPWSSAGPRNTAAATSAVATGTSGDFDADDFNSSDFQT